MLWYNDEKLICYNDIGVDVDINNFRVTKCIRIWLL